MASRQPSRLGITLAGLLAVAGGALAAGAPANATTVPAADAAAIDIDAAIEASREEGTLIIYGNPSTDQWTPVLDGFAEAYPWIEIETFDLGGTEAFQRYLSEEATGGRTADMIVNTDGAGWLDLIERGQVVDYVDPALADLPDFAVAAPGVFAMSVDPLVALFNKAVLPEDQQPTSLAELAAMAPDLSGRIGTVDVANGQVGLGNFGYIDAHGDEAWSTLEQLGPHTRVESGSGALLGKVQSGEYAAAFFISGSVRPLVDTTDAGAILNYRYFVDATPLPTRGMGVTAAAESPASAQVFIHWLLSADSDEARCGGGFTPYDEASACPQSLGALEAEIGEGNAIVVSYPADLAARQGEITARWNEAFGR